MNLQLFSSDENCNKKYSVEEGDPFFEDKAWAFGGIIETNEQTLFEDWNEIRNPDHPLCGLIFCYTMHCIVFHHPDLSWQDKLAIDNVWLEIKVDYPFFTN
jgi:hypothetical protein